MGQEADPPIHLAASRALDASTLDLRRIELRLPLPFGSASMARAIAMTAAMRLPGTSGRAALEIAPELFQLLGPLLGPMVEVTGARVLERVDPVLEDVAELFEELPAFAHLRFPDRARLGPPPRAAIRRSGLDPHRALGLLRVHAAR